jgi:hypothetical protein
VRIDEVEPLDRAFDSDQAILKEVRRESMMCARHRHKNTETQGK